MRVLTPAAGLLVAAPLAGWLLLGLGSVADSASTQPPASPDADRPSPNLVHASVRPDDALDRAAKESDGGPRRATVTVAPGDTLIGLLQDQGLGAGEAFRAVKALEDVYSPRRLKPGQDVRLALLPAGGDDDSGAKLKRLALRADPETDVLVRRDAEGGFDATTQARQLSRQVGGVAGTIDQSLFADGDRAGVPAGIMLKVIHQYSYAVDFQRDLRQGDRFEILYERFLEADGSLAKTGPLLYAALEVQGERLEIYRYTPEDGETGYFAPNGESVRRLLMRTPIDGARLSSGYGMRKHPIKGYTRMHEGVDFAAPPGTPIYASGTGRVVRIGYNGGYGKYVEIDHGHGFATAYAHMRGYADGLDRGDRVSQGEVIGYVGNTGRSTGPHLHYEILKHGEPVNPRSLDLPTGRTLTGAALERFEQTVAEIDRLRNKVPDKTRVAQASCEDSGVCQ